MFLMEALVTMKFMGVSNDYITSFSVIISLSGLDDDQITFKGGEICRLWRCWYDIIIRYGLIHFSVVQKMTNCLVTVVMTG